MTVRIAVLDMQPIDPPVGGGRLRLLGLYHDPGPVATIRYVGSYDWPGPGFRRRSLSDRLEEVLVPLSDAHFAAAAARRVGDIGVIDATFHRLARLSPDYVAAAREAAAESDIVVVSHPWAFPLVEDGLDRRRQLLVYDAHNVEGLLWTERLDHCRAGRAVARGVVALERAVCRAADLVLACSRQDGALFQRLYGVAPERVRIVPNGTFTDRVRPPDPPAKAAARAGLGLGPAPVALFLGSNYGPNIEAARIIADHLAPALPAIAFVVAGGVGAALDDRPRTANLVVTGGLSEADKLAWLSAADIAINPMAGGSGTTIKMLDFMAAGLPIVTTAIGARGIETAAEAFVVAAPAGFAAAVARLAEDAGRRATLGQAARQEAERSHSWERLSRDTGLLLARRHARRDGGPHFSVVVVADGRHDALERLLQALRLQTDRDFEVIIVDRGAGGPAVEAWPGAERFATLDLLYMPGHGGSAGQARNRGAGLAGGKVLAFLDPDCAPAQGWLAAARQALATAGTIGAEDHAQPAGTARSLFVISTTFHAAGGFRAADRDDDLAWRLRSFGAMAAGPAVGIEPPPAAPSLRQPAHLGWISTWNVACGIAEYSQNLFAGLSLPGGSRTTVFADDRSAPESRAGFAVRPCWRIASPIESLLRAVAEAAPDTVVIQHNPGLFSWSSLTDLLIDRRLAGRRRIVTLHNAQDLFRASPAERAAAAAALRAADLVLVHVASDLARLAQLEVSRNVRLFPHGARPLRTSPAASPEGAGPLVGCFGFFLPHKGIYQLIEATARLRTIRPGLRLRLVNAALPDSAPEIARCRALAAERGLDGAIDWRIDFLPEQQVIDLLGGCDLVALPYGAIEESASGALRLALASGAPIAVTPAAIFDEAEGAVARLAGDLPLQIATGLDALLADAPRRQALQEAAAAWMAERAWPRVAALFGRILTAETVAA